jgi:CoA:oxalate CoA-transferase
MTDAKPPRPLDGLRVLDLGQIYNGAYAGFLLAQAGADVVKVEPPTGENLRNRPTAHGAWYPFEALNINKRSICLDLKTELGRDRLLQLVSAADVLLENFAPGVMDRLGVGYEVLREANPRLVYASSSGYGNVSRYRDSPAMDLTVQAMVGVTSVTGFPDAPPVKAGVAIADFTAGVHMYAGIVSALWRREREGQGASVEVAMFDAAFPTLLSSLAVALGTPDETPTRTGNRHGGNGEAPYNVYPTRDGYVAIICVSDRQWVALAQIVGGTELAQDERFTTRADRVVNIDALDAAVAAWTRDRRRADVVAALLTKAIPSAPVRDLREVVEDPDLRERGFLTDVDAPDHGPIPVFNSPIRYDGQAPVPALPAPRMGEHTDEVLREWLSAPVRDGDRASA